MEARCPPLHPKVDWVNFVKGFEASFELKGGSRLFSRKISVLFANSAGLGRVTAVNAIGYGVLSQRMFFLPSVFQLYYLVPLPLELPLKQLDSHKIEQAFFKFQIVVKAYLQHSGKRLSPI